MVDHHFFGFFYYGWANDILFECTHYFFLKKLQTQNTGENHTLSTIRDDCSLAVCHNCVFSIKMVMTTLFV